MPNIITGNDPQQILEGDINHQDYGYQYPGELDLKPGSPLHTFIINQVMDRARRSRTIISNRFYSWGEIDKKLTAYIPLSQKEQEIRADDGRKPVSIVVPYSFAILETWLSYLVSAFLPEPIFRYEGCSPEDTLGAVLMEKVINLSCNRLKVALNLHTHFRDTGSYGLGVVAPGWTVRRGSKVVKQETGFFNFLGSFFSDGYKKETVDTVLFEGNSLQNVDPYRYLPDPNVPVQDVQKGEFVGWLDESNYMDLLDEEGSNPGAGLFNVKYLQHVQNKRSSIYSIDESKRMERYGGSSKDQTVTRPIDIINMYIKIVPRTWKVGDSEYPEKWMFSVAADSVVIKAQPIGLNHNMFPITVAAPDFDGYSPLAMSRIEMLQGMQEVLDWEFNSHVANVRKAINDMIIVDPYLVNINDIKDPKPGKLIRLRRPAWGKGVKEVAQQLVVNDITRANISDASFIIQYMQQIAGTDNPMMGSLRRGGPERLTSKEFQGTAMGAISRLERVAKVIGLQSMQDIGYMFAHHTQQLMNEDVYVSSIGRWAEDLEREYAGEAGRVKVSPFDILVDYDLLVRDGSVPGGNYADVWAQLFQTIMSSEALGQRFDVMRIFKHIARNIGAKNVDDFEIKQMPQVNTQVLPDEVVEGQAQAGNIIPFGG